MRQLWEDAAREYFEPSRFVVHLQSCITTGRSVTFILQKQKGSVAGFDDWYAPHRQKLAEDPIMRWSQQARNFIEKEGDLKTLSQVRGEIIVSYYEGPVTEWIPQALFASPFDFFRALPREITEIPFVQANGTLLIERRWVDDQLPDLEVLEALAHVYKRLAAVVDDFCRLLDVPAPDWLSEEPASMDALAMDRALYLSMRDGSAAGLRVLPKPDEKVRKKMLRKRYGKHEPLFRELRAANSFEELAHAQFNIARRLMTVDGYHEPFSYFFKGNQLTSLILSDHPDRATRYVMMRDLAKLAKIEGVDGYMLIAEAWMAKPTDSPTGFAADAPNRTEALTLIAGNSTGEVCYLWAPIERKRKQPSKVRRLGETQVEKGKAVFLLYPFQKEWGCVDNESYRAADKEAARRGFDGDIWVNLRAMSEDPGHTIGVTHEPSSEATHDS